MTPSKKAPAAGGAANGGLENATHNPKHKPSAPDCQAPSPAIDLVNLRDRLVEARRRLLERVAEDYPADRRFPDTSWTRMLADIHIAIAAVDAVVAEGGP